jgi:hypothetical protein
MAVRSYNPYDISHEEICLECGERFGNHKACWPAICPPCNDVTKVFNYVQVLEVVEVKDVPGV